MISELRFRSRVANAPIDVDVYIDGQKIDTLQTYMSLKEGMALESEAIAEALQGRQVTGTSFTDTRVDVSTVPA